MGTEQTAFPQALQLLEKRLSTFLTELDSLQGPLAGPAKPPELIKFNTGNTIGEAMRALASYNILSAPVSDAATGEYVGLVDVGDVLHGLIHGLYPELLDRGFLEGHSRLSAGELLSVGLEFTAQRLGSVLHRGDLWYKGDPDSTVLEVVETGFRVGLPLGGQAPAHQLRVHHRVAVFDILPGEQTPDGPVPEWRITDVVSQTDVLRLLAAHVAELAPDPFSASLASLGLVRGRDAVTTVPADMPALSAFALMHHRRLSGVGVVDPDSGALVANLSVSDLRGLTPNRFGALALPVGAFLLLQRGGGLSWDDALLGLLPPAAKEGRWAEALAGMAPVRCAPDASLAEALDLLVKAGKHRVYVTGRDGVTEGIITPTDVLRLVTSRKA